jgi:predicted class III extradiol MEMO1 family dioxygenase
MNYFCSVGCYNQFAHKHIERIVAIAPRHTPLETPIEDPKKEKHETGYGHTYYNTTIKERVDTST